MTDDASKIIHPLHEYRVDIDGEGGVLLALTTVTGESFNCRMDMDNALKLRDMLHQAASWSQQAYQDAQAERRLEG
jgi:hypothetical protein